MGTLVSTALQKVTKIYISIELLLKKCHIDISKEKYKCWGTLERKSNCGALAYVAPELNIDVGSPGHPDLGSINILLNQVFFCEPTGSTVSFRWLVHRRILYFIKILRSRL